MRLPSAATLLLSAAAAVRAQPQIALGPDIIDDGNTKVVTDIQHAPGDSDRLFVVFRDGRIRILRDFTGENGAYDDTDFLDIRTRVHDGCGECGLLGLAFHPDYDGGTNNGYFYVNYIRISPESELQTFIARYSVLDSNLADVGSEVERLVINQPRTNHNGGQIQFGPCTGRSSARTCLYIGMGDSGGGCDPDDSSQKASSLLGKMLRIDVNDGESWTAAGNPALEADGFDPMVWALGLRNPWRFSFDSETDDMYIADVGQDDREEVNLQKASSTGGENYGWEGWCEGFGGLTSTGPSSCYVDAAGPDCSSPGSAPVLYGNYTAPIFDYAHVSGKSSLTGGYVYRGSAYPDLDGVYIYGDYSHNWIRGAKDDGGWNPSYASKVTLNVPTTFGQDANGELYVGTWHGAVRQIRVPTPQPSTSPSTSQQPSKRTPEPTSSPTTNPSSSPSKSPIKLGVSCPVPPDHTRVLLDGELVLHYSILEDPANLSTIGGIFCARLELNRVAWIGFGRQVSTGGMQGDVAILHYESGAWVAKKYTVSGTNQFPEEMPAESQTLFDVDFDPNPSSKTYFEFTKFLTEADELPYAADGSNRVLFAVGKPLEPVLAQHSTEGRGALVLDLTPCPALPCDGGQECQQPACATCDGCSEANCPSSGCRWIQGVNFCEGNLCTDCKDETECGNAGCKWNSKRQSCKGGDQPNLGEAGRCEGTVGVEEWVCPANPTPGTDSPTTSPTPPTKSPTKSPSAGPTVSPSKSPSAGPTAGPTSPPTAPPTQTPMPPPVDPPAPPVDPSTKSPTESPTQSPSKSPTESPTNDPTESPTKDPTESPTSGPTRSPTAPPTNPPTDPPATVQADCSNESNSKSVTWCGNKACPHPQCAFTCCCKANNQEATGCPLS